MRILDIATSVEDGRLVGLDELQDLYGWSDRDQRIFSRLYGLRSACLHEGGSLRDTLAASLSRLMTANPGAFGRIDGLLYCHALNNTTPIDHHILGELARRFLGGVPEVFSITNSACASAISALEFLAGTVTANVPGRLFVILTGEKCFDAVLQYAPQSGLFGEGTTAALIDIHPEDGKGFHVVASAHGRVAGIYDPVVKHDLETRNRFDDAYIPTIVAVIERALARARIGARQLDVLLPTHLSPFTFDKVARQLGIPDVEIIKDNLSILGHCFCGDAFINLRSWRDGTGKSARNSYAMTFAAGMTGTFAALILRKDGDDAW